MKKLIEGDVRTDDAIVTNGQERGLKTKHTRNGGEVALPLSRNLTLSDQESKDLEQSEKIIQTGWKSFLDVGRALMKIQKQKLYRDRYATFEQYCRDHLEISRPYAYNLIGSAEVFEDLSSIEDISCKPANEAQTRCLIGLPKENRIAAWRKALEKAGGQRVTSKLVREAVVKYKQVKMVVTDRKSSTKKSTVDQLMRNLLMRLLNDADDSLKAKDYSKTQKFLQRMQEAFLQWTE